MKLCECGCGKETLLYPQTDNKRGFTQGQPKRFLRGHNLKSKRWSPVSDKCLECSTNVKKHGGKGLCVTCYKRKWALTPTGVECNKRKISSEHTKKHRHDYYIKTYKDKAKENARRWVERNLEKRRVVSINYVHTRRSRMSETDITKDYIEKMKSEAVYCPLCGITLAKHGKYPDGRQLDHILPLYRGGLHIRSNIRYICALCNSTHR